MSGAKQKNHYDEFNPIYDKVYKNKKFLVKILEEPDPSAKIIKKMRRGAEFITIDIVESPHGLWRKIFYKTYVGYIDVKTPVKPVTGEENKSEEIVKFGLTIVLFSALSVMSDESDLGTNFWAMLLFIILIFLVVVEFVLKKRR